MRGRDLAGERGVAPLLLLAFIVVPLVELYVIIQVGQVIGAWWTIAVLLAVSVAGAWLVKREGRATWARFRDAIGTGRMPAVEVVDGALVLIGGTLLLTPGFLSDIAGILLVLPPSRAVVNRLVRSRVRMFALGGRGTPRHVAGERPVDVEVVEVKRNTNGQR